MHARRASHGLARSSYRNGRHVVGHSLYHEVVFLRPTITITLLDDLGGLVWRLFSRLLNVDEAHASALTKRMAEEARPAH
jgi:hypothetical protein